MRVFSRGQSVRLASLTTRSERVDVVGVAAHVLSGLVSLLLFASAASSSSSSSSAGWLTFSFFFIIFYFSDSLTDCNNWKQQRMIDLLRLLLLLCPRPRRCVLPVGYQTIGILLCQLRIQNFYCEWQSKFTDCEAMGSREVKEPSGTSTARWCDSSTYSDCQHTVSSKCCCFCCCIHHTVFGFCFVCLFDVFLRTNQSINGQNRDPTKTHNVLFAFLLSIVVSCWCLFECLLSSFSFTAFSFSSCKYGDKTAIN